MEYLTKYISKYNNNNKYILLNALSGAVDMVGQDIYEKIVPGKKIDNATFNSDIIQALKDRMYLFESPLDEANYLKNLKYTYIQSGNKKSTMMICPTYSCNLNCSYCFEGELTKRNTTLTEEQIRIALNACGELIKDLNLEPRFGIFGGEPLLTKNYNQIKIIIDWMNSNNYEIGIPTNAINLDYFLEYFKKNLKRGVLQITLDGDEKEHNLRRGYRGKEGLNPFTRTTSNIDSALKTGLNVFLRINIDRKNIGNLDFLINFLNEKGWLRLENLRVGITNIVDHKSDANNVCYDEYDLYCNAHKVLDNYPNLVDLIDFKMLRVLSHIEAIITGKEVPTSPKLYYCETCSSHYVFGSDGLVYPCTEVMGDEKEAIGRFLPELVIYDAAAAIWQNRNIFNIKECSECEIFSFCGGGCAISAKYISGDISKPYCGNAKEILQRFIQHYLTSLKK